MHVFWRELHFTFTLCKAPILVSFFTQNSRQTRLIPKTCGFSSKAFAETALHSGRVLYHFVRLEFIATPAKNLIGIEFTSSKDDLFLKLFQNLQSFNYIVLKIPKDFFAEIAINCKRTTNDWTGPVCIGLS